MGDIYKNGVSGSQKNIIVRERLTANCQRERRDLMTLEDFLEFLEKDFKREKSFMVNPQRQMDFAKAYRNLERLIADECINAHLWCEMGELINGYAIISIKADWIIVREMDKFYAAVRAADNFEVFVVEDGMVQMNIIFHGVRSRVK